MQTSYLDRVISVVPEATNHQPFAAITIGQALEEIRTGRYRAYVERVRALADKEHRRRANDWRH